MATLSQVRGTIDSVIVQSSWLGVKTPWIIFKPVLSEGTISLFITLTSALSLTCFYYIYKTFSTMDTYSNDNYKEQLSKMEIAYLVFSGNILSGKFTKLIAFRNQTIVSSLSNCSSTIFISLFFASRFTYSCIYSYDHDLRHLSIKRSFHKNYSSIIRKCFNYRF